MPRDMQITHGGNRIEIYRIYVSQAHIDKISTTIIIGNLKYGENEYIIESGEE